MLQEWKAMEKPEEEEIRARLAAAKEKLYSRCSHLVHVAENL